MEIKTKKGEELSQTVTLKIDKTYIEMSEKA